MNNCSIDSRDMIERFLPLVDSIVYRMKVNLPRYIAADELRSTGRMGLMAAVTRYDPHRQQAFPSYAATRIRGAILDELRRMDRTPRRMRGKINILNKATAKLEQKLGRAMTEDELRISMELTPEAYATLVRKAHEVTFINLDEQSPNENDPEGPNLHECVPDESDRTGRDILEEADLHEILLACIARLPDISQKILRMYYFDSMTFAEISKAFGLTESRICQINRQTLTDIKQYLARRANR